MFGWTQFDPSQFNSPWQRHDSIFKEDDGKPGQVLHVKFCMVMIGADDGVVDMTES